MFTRPFLAGWGDMDFNGHMRNTAYLDKSADLRMLFFATHGFSTAEFARQRFGPVVRSDQVDYFREIHLLEEMQQHLAIAGLSDDGSRFSIRNEFFRADGELSARVTSLGGWLDLAARRLIAPPPGLLDALRALPHSDDFEDLSSSLK